MSEDENNTESNLEKVPTFTRRKSKHRKTIIDCISSAETDFITVHNEDSGEKFTTGFTRTLLLFIDNHNLVHQFCDLSRNELKITRGFFRKFILPLIFDTPDKLKFEDRLAEYIWSKIYCTGGSTPFSKNNERVAFARFKRSVDPNEETLVDGIRDAAFSLLKTDMRSMLRQYTELCRMLLSSNKIYYSFFVVPEELKGQLAETISMNTCISIEFDAYREMFERFVRNQLLLFSKTHHMQDAKEPSETLDQITIKGVEDMSLSDTVKELVAVLESTRTMIYASQEAYQYLVARAQTDISPSESTITKTILRQWANRQLSSIAHEYHIKNSYDSAFCRFMEYLGNTYEFGVRGRFRFPIAIYGVQNTKKRQAPTGLNPEQVLRKFDDGIEKLSRKIAELKNKKRTYEDTDEVQQYIKRQRQENEEESAEVENMDEF